MDSSDNEGTGRTSSSAVQLLLVNSDSSSSIFIEESNSLSQTTTQTDHILEDFGTPSFRVFNTASTLSDESICDEHVNRIIKEVDSKYSLSFGNALSSSSLLKRYQKTPFLIAKMSYIDNDKLPMHHPLFSSELTSWPDFFQFLLLGRLCPFFIRGLAAGTGIYLVDRAVSDGYVHL